MAGELEAPGIDLIVPGQSIDTSRHPTGRLLFNVLGAIAQFERDLMGERVVAGMKAAKRPGRAMQRSGSRRLLAGGCPQRNDMPLLEPWHCAEPGWTVASSAASPRTNQDTLCQALPPEVASRAT